MSPLFDEIYADTGRLSVPHVHLHKASLLMAFYMVRSKRQFCEQLSLNLLFKWFQDIILEDEPLHQTTCIHRLETDPVIVVEQQFCQSN